MSKQLTANDHIQAAIVAINAEIGKLEDEGTRPGCMVKSITGDSYTQWHWCHGKKRVYTKKSLVPVYQSEMDRFKQVAALQTKINLLNQAL